MSGIFLSASIPVAGRGDFYKTADPFLIQMAVRECVMAALGRRKIIWGGHPSITPMVWAVAEDLDVKYGKTVVLYQTQFFEGFFPEENARFENVAYVEAVKDDLKASLTKMREEMIGQQDIGAAVFIGGMEGIFEEYELILKHHPEAKIICVPAAGGAALDLAKKLGVTQLDDVDFSMLMHQQLDIAINEERKLEVENNPKPRPTLRP